MSTTGETKEQQAAALETTVSKAQAALSRLDEEYKDLDQEEQQLMLLLHKTQSEEACLRQALKEATETGAQRRAREMKQKEDAAVARMESALFESDSSDDDDDNNKVAGESIQMAAL